MQAATDKLIQVFRADVSLCDAVRDAVGAFFAHCGASTRAASRARAVADELYANAVRYGSVRDSDLIFVRLQRTGDHVALSVEDRGAQGATDPEVLRATIRRNRENVTPADASGRGLSLIVTGWSRDVSIERSSLGGLKITSVLPLS